MKSNNSRFVAAMAALCAATTLTACDTEDDGEATLRVAIYGEEYIEDMIPATDVVDGWEIQFSTFLVAVTDISADGTPLAGTHLFDLAPSSGGEGHAVGEITVPAGVTSSLAYRIAPAGAFDGGNAKAEQTTMMVDGGYSLFVEGTATREGETKSFAWAFSNDTAYQNCAVDRELSDGGEDSVEITIHGDHLFFDDLESSEPEVAFDILARADADADGVVTSDEMAALDISGESRYQVGSRSIADLWGFVDAQTALVGHIDGEGHCDAG